MKCYSRTLAERGCCIGEQGVIYFGTVENLQRKVTHRERYGFGINKFTFNSAAVEYKIGDGSSLRHVYVSPFFVVII